MRSNETPGAVSREGHRAKDERSRNLSPLEPSVVTVGIVRGGTRFNIIPDEVHLEGTVRSYNPDVRDIVERHMGEILESITAAAGGTYELDYDRGIAPCSQPAP